MSGTIKGGGSWGFYDTSSDALYDNWNTVTWHVLPKEVQEA